MKHHFTQLGDGVSDDFKPASNFEVVVATVVLALLLQIFWRCCRSFYLNRVKKYISSFSSSSSAVSSLEPSTIAAVEEILNYTFKDKRLLEEALTHSSCRESISYDRLEFLGDAALGLMVATYFFRLEPKLNSDRLSRLREKSVRNERLTYVAARLGLYLYVRTNDTAKPIVEDDHGNLTIRSPYILADIVEALAGAVYVDLDFDSAKLWTIFKDGNPDYTYRLVKEGRSQHESTMTSTVEIKTHTGVLRQEGDEKSTEKDARNSAAYRLLRSLHQSSVM
ncbi:RNASEIII-LIKE 2, RNAse THREE-like protein 2 [Hibiscus trionum]|uniref:RNASEIII-LIKE 2, RNAse THREE-like protein 2 n=1 Tax=Hibiscus trionum TaxID=183268 RepID=A0A9W7HAY6_HIBTR|nr:RNASEIII-LIKE 2, RNAse THREE-like protein 2 [Hibiscus trionum]